MDYNLREIFSELSEEELRQIFGFVDIVDYPPKFTVIKEGEKSKEVFIIKSGSVFVKRKGKILATLKRGDVFGEMASIEELPRSATIETIEKTQVYRITGDSFLKLLKEKTNVAISILKILSNRLRKLTEYIVEKEFQEERLATIGKLSSTIIHDLKSPLAAIKGYIGLLKDKNLDSETKSYLETMNEAVDYILNMIEEILEFGREKTSILYQKVNLKEFITDFVNVFSKTIKDKEINIRIESDENIFAEIDPNKFKRVINNLLKNSVEAIEKKGTIDIKIQKQDEYVQLVVKDTGIGMQPYVLERIFEPFFSFGKVGTGLGMTVVKKIVDDHEGKIEVQSKPNEGTTFKITIPQRWKTS